MSKVWKVGKLAEPDALKGVGSLHEPSPEALAYYNTPVKHWTHTNWDEIDMSKVDVGLHSDPTKDAIQAKDRRLNSNLMGMLGDDTMKDMRIHVGNSIHAEDVGTWDVPSVTYRGILNALEERDWDLAERFSQEFSDGAALSDRSTIKGDAGAVEDMGAMRQWLLDNDIDTIQYQNTSEGADLAADAATTSPEWLSFEADMLQRAEDYYQQSNKYRETDWAKFDELQQKGLEIEDELEYARDEVLQQAAADNLSYISLDPGNVRDANAAFSKENIGKAGMMLGVGGMALLPSEESEASTMDVARKLAANSGATQVATTGGTYKKAGDIFSREGVTGDILDYGAGLGHGTQHLGDNAFSLEVNPKPQFTPDFTSSEQMGDRTFGGIANLNVLNVLPEPIRSQVAQDILGRLDVGGVGAIGARSYNDVMGAKNPQILDDGGIVTQKGTYQYGFGGKNEGLVPYLERQAQEFPDREYEIKPEKLAATGAMVRRIKSLAPLGTLGALGALSSNDTAAADIGAGVLDVASRGGEMLVNDLLQGSQSVSNAIYNTRDAAPQVRFAPRTEAGNALSEGLMSDLGNYLNYSGLVEGMPSTSDLIGMGVDAYKEYVQPHLSERQEMGLGGGLLAASTLMPGSKAAKAGDWVTDTRTVVRNTEGERLGRQTGPRRDAMLEDPAGSVREEIARAGNYETIVSGVPDHRNLPVLRASDLEGGVVMPTAGDRTMAGILEQVQGQRLSNPLDLQAGPVYGMVNPDAWESTPTIARSYQDKVRKVAEDAGTDRVFGMYSPMAIGSAEFSTMPAEAFLRQMLDLEQAGARFNPRMVDAIDAAARKVNPDFPGILSPDAESFVATNSMAGVRKAILREARKAPYKDSGFPIVDQIMRDISVPELLGHQAGQSGDIILRLDPRGQTHSMSNHRSYGEVIPGGIKGRLAESAPFETLYPDAWRQLEGVTTSSGKRELNRLEKISTVNWNKPGGNAKTSGYQKITDQYLEDLVKRGLLKP